MMILLVLMTLLVLMLLPSTAAINDLGNNAPSAEVTIKN
jgi:hypothetical protein